MIHGLVIQLIRVDLRAAGQHLQHCRRAAHLFDLGKLGEHIVHVELALHHPPGGFLRLLVVLHGLRLLNEGKHIAHAKDAAGHPRGIEGLQVLQLFAGALEVNRLAGDGQHRERRAAAGVAIRLGEHHTGDADLLVEGLGHVDGFLTGHGVHHQQGLVHLNGFLDAHQLVHQRVIDLQTARGIQNHDVIAVVLCVSHRFLGDEFGLFVSHLEHRNARLLTHDAQLVNGCGTVDVTGHQHGAAALTAVELAQLGRVGGLAVALQAAHHNDGLAFVFQAQILRLIAAHELGQLLVDDLDHLLGGGQAFHDLLPHGPLGHLIAEILGDLVVDIGLQQRHAHFPHGGLDVLLVQLALAAQLFENAGKALCQ